MMGFLDNGDGVIIMMNQNLEVDTDILLKFMDSIAKESDNLTFGHGEMNINIE